MHRVIVVGLGAVLLLAAAGQAGAACPTNISLPPGTVCDLNGEVCRSGSVEIGGQTFCIMLGRLRAGEALEMDDVNVDDPDPVSPSASEVIDANVFAGPPEACVPGNDPNCPAVAGATFIDWNDLFYDATTRPEGIVRTIDLLRYSDGKPVGTVEDHRITDFTANKDWTIFSSGASCVTSGSSLPKEDFMQTYIANNDEYMYFAQDRRTNNGNSVYYWMLTRQAPRIVQNGACGANTRGELQFTLTPAGPGYMGDVQVVLNFPSSSNPAGGSIFLRRYTGAAVSNVPADDAVFAGWTTVPGVVDHFALTEVVDTRNPVPDDRQPDWGGYTAQGEATAQTGSLYYLTASMAEWAISLQNIFGAQHSVCGEQFFITGISRSATGQSSDPTEPADLKDLVGPKVYSFGNIEATASASPVCDPQISSDYVFEFEAAATDVGHLPVPTSDLSCTWTCTSSDCGQPSLSYDDASQCTGAGLILREDGAAGAGPCHVSCSVEVTQTSTACSDSAESVTVALAPIEVALTVVAGGAQCPDEAGIAAGVTFGVTASGGDLDYTYLWSVTGPSPACGDAATCPVTFAASDYCAQTLVQATVQDGSICPDATTVPGGARKWTAVEVF